MKQKNIAIKNSYLIFSILGIIFSAIFAAGVLSANSLSISNAIGVKINLINQIPDPAIAGDVSEIRLGILNSGDAPVSNLQIEFIPTYPFEQVLGEDTAKEIGTLDKYQGYFDITQQKNILYKIKINNDATPNTYNLKMRYYALGSLDYTEVLIPINVKSRDDAKTIHLDKTVLIPGHETELKFTIDNIGNSPLRDLVFSFENPDDVVLPVGGDNTKYISYLESGKSVDLIYTALANTNSNPGLYKLNLNLKYKDPLTGTDKTITTVAGIYVGGDTDFDVSYSDSSSGQYSFSVANIGSTQANSILVKIPEQRGWSVTGSNSVIVGNLNTGDYTVASFKLSAASARNSTELTTQANPGNQRQFNTNSQNTGQNFLNSTFAGKMRNTTSDSIIVEIAYTNTMGERKIMTKEVKIGTQSSVVGSFAAGTGFARTNSQKSIFSNYWTYVVMVLLALTLVYFIWKKYKKSNNDEIVQKRR